MLQPMCDCAQGRQPAARKTGKGTGPGSSKPAAAQKGPAVGQSTGFDAVRRGQTCSHKVPEYPTLTYVTEARPWMHLMLGLTERRQAPLDTSISTGNSSLSCTAGMQHAHLRLAAQMTLAQSTRPGNSTETRIHRTARRVLNFMYFCSAAGKLTLPTQETIIRCVAGCHAAGASHRVTQAADGMCGQQA